MYNVGFINPTRNLPISFIIMSTCYCGFSVNKIKTYENTRYTRSKSKVVKEINNDFFHGPREILFSIRLYTKYAKIR